MKLKKRYLIAPLAAILLTSPMNHAKNNSAKASYLENIVENFSSLIGNRPIEIPEVTIYGKKPTIEEVLLKMRMQEQNSEKISTPYFKLKKEKCSRYARRAAKKLFNKNYNSDDAWELRYKNKIIKPISEDEEVKYLIIDEKLKPGMLLAVHYPQSKHNDRIDSQGKKVNYTHVMVYTGLDNDGNPTFVHQFGRKIEKIRESDFKKKKYEFTPKEIIDSYN